MRWYGKLLGFVAGWLLLRHPGGAVIGLLVGHAFDADWLRPKKYDPYAVLGLRDDASEGEIDRAYRRLIAQYHPDRLAGAADELRLQAEDKAREINAAYDHIRKLRGQ
ncbi:J domain-containing protein [Arenimonas sp. MALMAid1274]|uniref:J domain-containing protein n=1 Tax=Arenimonas sp. MALMAid1274 TaxID=3411630 RepID=UPI003B9DF754